MLLLNAAIVATILVPFLTITCTCKAETVVFEPLLGGAPCWRIPSLVAISPTKLLAFAGSRCEPGDGCSPHNFTGSANRSMVGLRRSLDGGSTWLPLQVLYEAPCVGGYPGSVILQPNAVYDPFTAIVHVMFMATDHKHLLVTSSDNEGVVWKQRASPIPISPANDTSPGNGVVLSSGQILLLGQSGSEGAYVIASDDGGDSFHPLSNPGAAAPGQTLEPQAVELAGGAVYLKGHTGVFTPQGGVVSEATLSKDAGSTWQALKFSEVFNLTTCQGGLSGTRPMWNNTKSPPTVSDYGNTLFFSHPNIAAAAMSKGGAASRYNGTVWRSDDGGVSWNTIASITADTFSAEEMFAYSVMTPIGIPVAVGDGDGDGVVVGDDSDGDSDSDGDRDQDGAVVVVSNVDDDMPERPQMQQMQQMQQTQLPMGLLYETGDSQRCGVDPRYGHPSQSCIVVFKSVNLPLPSM